jgi:DNA (cytosine-5)-methyltransferase 1
MQAYSYPLKTPERLPLIQQKTMIDLFAGAGGLSLGLESAGFSAIYANEYISQFAATYAANHPGTIVDTRDIRNVNPSEIMAETGLVKGELVLLAGGPPCQGFSVNAPRRSTDDKRNHLFLDYLKFVEAFAPQAVIIENVPGLVSFEGGATLDAILGSLDTLGYSSDVQILYAPHFGVPQTRWRTIVIGIRKDIHVTADIFPSPQHSAPARVNFTSVHRNRNLVGLADGPELSAHTTVGDAISDLPRIKSGESVPDGTPYTTSAESTYQTLMRQGSSGVFNHKAAALGQVNVERLAHIPAGGNWTNIPVDLLPAGMKRAHRSDHTKRYGRTPKDGLSSTILTKCDPHWGAYFHYEQPRTFTVREAARIQSFPDFYSFTGTISDQFAQVGNAVPPLMATAIGRQVVAALESEPRNTSEALGTRT